MVLARRLARYLDSNMNDILQSFVAGTARKDALKQQAIANDLAQQQHDDTAKYHQGLLDEAFDKLDEVGRQNDIHNKLAQQLHNAQLGQLRNQLAVSIQSGEPVAGSKLLGEEVDKTTGYRKQKYQLPDYANTPDGAPVTIDLLHPEDYAKSKANLERTTLAPKIEGKIAEQDALQKAETTKLLTVEDTRAAHSSTLKKMELDNQNAVSALLRASQEKIGAGHDKAAMAGHAMSASATMEAARIRSGSELAQSLMTPGPDGSTPSDQINQSISNGKMSLPDLKQMFPNAPAVVQMFALSAAKNGVGFIDKKQQATLPAWQQLGNVIPKMQALIAQQSQSSNGIEAATKGMIDKLTNPAYKNLNNEIQAILPTIATAIGGEQGQRLSDAKLKKAEGWIPDPSLPPQENQKRLQNFIREVNDMFNSSYRNLSAAQRLHIQDELGISKFLLPSKTKAAAPNSLNKLLEGIPNQ